MSELKIDCAYDGNDYLWFSEDDINPQHNRLIVGTMEGPDDEKGGMFLDMPRVKKIITFLTDWYQSRSLEEVDEQLPLL